MNEKTTFKVLYDGKVPFHFIRRHRSAVATATEGLSRPDNCYCKLDAKATFSSAISSTVPTAKPSVIIKCRVADGLHSDLQATRETQVQMDAAERLLEHKPLLALDALEKGNTEEFPS